MKILLIFLGLCVLNVTNASNSLFFSLDSYENFQQTVTEFEIPDSAINRLTAEDENFISCIYQFKDEDFANTTRVGLNIISATNDEDEAEKTLVMSLFATAGKTNAELEEDVIAFSANIVKKQQMDSIARFLMLNTVFKGYSWTISLSGKDMYRGETKEVAKTSIMTDKEWKKIGKYEGVKMNKWYCFFED